jgi:hypothetical protein
MFQIAYVALIALIVLIVLGIVLIHRSVRGATRDLGITFLSYGAIEFAGVIIGRYVLKQMLPQMEIPQQLQDLPVQLMHSLTSPLFTFSLACLIGGIVLIVVSFVYQRQSAEPAR